ncbi:MAG: hypothetical protein U0V75_06485 [Ferruginibacter sp.]
MNRYSLAFTVALLLQAVSLTAQETLPGITVKNISGQIIVSWVNDYKIPVANISIQRSYDSLKNYTTIGAVLNPQNMENGYADVKPPYNKMYYRVFVSFEGGTYAFSKIARPVKEIIPEPVITNDRTDTSKTGAAGAGGIVKEDSYNPFLVKDNWIARPAGEPGKIQNGGIAGKPQLPKLETNTELITYPSRRIYTSKDNNIVIALPGAETKKYTVKFFDENDNPLFELNKITEAYLIIEKVNFVKSGWYHFDVYENGKLIEKNKFFVPKDGKNQGNGGK